MAFGRPTPNDHRRAEVWRKWITDRHPLAVVSLVLGIFSAIELGALIVPGVAGIIVGTAALIGLRRQPALKGNAMSWAGIALSAASLVVAAAIYLA